MKTIYYASCVDPEVYHNEFMLYSEPDSLYKDLLASKDKSNDYNNYLDCPAFLKFAQNMFVVRSPWNCELTVDYSTGKFLIDNQETEISDHFKPRPNCRDRMMFNMYHNFIFFSEDSIEVSTMPAFMHNSELQTKCTYIPGTYDISKWFRSIDGAFEMQQPLDCLNLKKGDPLYYVKFDTSDSVKLVRFNLTPDLWKLTQGCIHYKKYQSRRALTYLYNLFFHSGMQRLTLTKIKENII